MDGGYWIPERDNGHRMWRCSRCDRRMVGSVWDENFNPYHFCPYCGSHNQTEQGEQLRMDGEGGGRADGGLWPLGSAATTEAGTQSQAGSGRADVGIGPYGEGDRNG